MTRDMIKKKKQGFSFMLQKCKIWHFLKITVLTFFIISPVIFGLQKCTLSQIKALEILFWPCFIIFSPRINICWAIMSRSCIIFFYLVLKVAQTVFVPHFDIATIWQIVFFFFMNFCILGKRTDAYDFTKKEKLWIWYHFINRIFKFILSTFFLLTL